jgi:hypothetical protein
MIATLLLAGVCNAIPVFGVTGPLCQDYALECGCSECMVWDPPVAEPGSARIDYYEVQRTNPSGSFSLVGGTSRFDWLDEETGELHITDPVTVWCPAKDTPMPREGRLYGYMVRACNNERGCGGYSNGIEYRAAPYAVDQFRPPVVGNQ